MQTAWDDYGHDTRMPRVPETMYTNGSNLCWLPTVFMSHYGFVRAARLLQGERTYCNLSDWEQSRTFLWAENTFGNPLPHKQTKINEWTSEQWVYHEHPVNHSSHICCHCLALSIKRLKSADHTDPIARQHAISPCWCLIKHDSLSLKLLPPTLSAHTAIS